ncbi:PREDICTED: guanosine-3',5'-bis(diphosphate) 3'-pyrophosphohydrolase MESH1-like, partial [Priapulus caudatus]|uniref:Guanosine-3',5'-bis(diphosphate) 3'-pyrophosphohydrolase MESH1 n=1 Tax=Priapulus caudatus TaxID=37621 RepID=A0ABM1EYP9_PRICU
GWCPGNTLADNCIGHTFCVLGVAYILTNEGNVTDTDVIQAALLHDTVEDTDTSLAEIESVFGARVCAIVAEVTDDKSLPKAERKRQQVAHAAHASRGAKLVKLADKLYNVRDLARATPAGWDAARVAEYVAWAERVVRGLRGVNALMERALDEAFAAAGVEVAKGSPGE